MKFNFGDTVLILSNALERYHPGSIGSLCGTRILDDKNQAVFYNVSVGTALWIVEFRDGSSIEVPEQYITLMKD